MYKNFLLAAVALLVTAGQVTAAIDTFQGAYPYNYNDAANWSNGHLPDSTVDALIANGGGDSTVVLSDYLDPTYAGNTPGSLSVGAVLTGYYGAGALQLTSNAYLKVVNGLNVGYQGDLNTHVATAGTLQIDAGTLNVTNVVGGTNAGCNVGVSTNTYAANGSVTVNGGTLSIVGAMKMGLSGNLNSVSYGSLTLNGGTTSFGNLVAASGGSADVAVNTGATLTLNGGSTSTFGYGSVAASTGTLTVAGGTVNVTSPSSLMVFGSKNAHGSLTITSGSFTQGGTSSSLVIAGGASGAAVGSFSQSGGSVSVNKLYFGDYGTGTGTINGTAAMTVANTLNVGDRGVGQVTQSAGNVTVGTLAVAPAHTGGNGSYYTISGGSLTTSALTLGGTAGTSATLNVQGGNVTMIGAGGTVPATVTTAATGNLNVSGGVINAAGATIGTLGSFAFTGGTLNNIAAVNTGVAVTSGTATFNQDTGYDATVSGAITGAGGVTKTGVGSLTLSDGVNTYTGKTAAGGGKLTFASTGSFNVLNAGAGNSLDLQHGTVVFDYTGGTDPVAAIRTNLRNSYVAGGSKLSTGSLYTSTGYGTGYGISYVSGAQDLSGLSTETLKIALYGDTDGLGAVNSNDVSRVLANLGKASGATWYQGDFNYDGAVNSNDVSILLANLGKTFGGMTSPLALSGSPTPEPSTLVLLATGLAGLLAYAWRKRK